MSDIRNKWETAMLASDLVDSLKITAWAIRKFANLRGDCYPSQQTLAITRNCCDRTIRRHLLILEGLGWIQRIKGAGKTGIGGTTDLIELTIPESPDTIAVRACQEGRPDTIRVHTLEEAEMKGRTNSNGRPDSNCERPDKSDPKTGHYDVPQTNNHYLNHGTSASLCNAHKDIEMNDMKNEEPPHEPERTPNHVRQEVIDAVKNYGSRDIRSALLFVGATVEDAQRPEIESAINYLMKTGSL